MEDEVLLSVRELSQSFRSGSRRVRALDRVSFDIRRAEIFGLVGESGSGKSTTGRVISGIYEPSGGEVAWRGEVIRMGEREPIERKRAARRRAAGQKLSLALDMIKNPKNAKNIKKELENVNLNLQNIVKTEQKRIDEAREVGRRWSRGAHPGIRMVFQDPTASLNPRMTVGEAVGEAMRGIGVRDREQIARTCAEAIARVGLPPSAISRYPHEFSGGQRQRVGIARAIVTRPELLIADEPISALDVSVGAQVVNLLCELARGMSLSVLFIAHDLAMVRHICDRVAVMYKGRIVELAEAEELFTNPLHPYTRALLASAPPPDPRAARRAAARIEQARDYPTEGELSDVGGGHMLLAPTGRTDENG